MGTSVKSIKFNIKNEQDTLQGLWLLETKWKETQTITVKRLFYVVLLKVFWHGMYDMMDS